MCDESNRKADWNDIRRQALAYRSAARENQRNLDKQLTYLASGGLVLSMTLLKSPPICLVLKVFCWSAFAASLACALIAYHLASRALLKQADLLENTYPKHRSASEVVVFIEKKMSAQNRCVEILNFFALVLLFVSAALFIVALAVGG